MRRGFVAGILAMLVVAGVGFAFVTEGAQALLDRADARLLEGDFVEATRLYMEAVKLDSSVASLDRIDFFAEPIHPTFEGVEREPTAEGMALRAAALRQYLGIQPDDWEGAKELTEIVPIDEAEKVIEPFTKSRATDADVFGTRALLRARNNRYKAALGDFVKAAALDPQNAERHYLVEEMPYEGTKESRTDVTEEEKKRALIVAGIASAVRAEALRPDYFEALVYHNLLLRELAKREKDEAKKNRLIAEADRIRAAAVEVVKRRRGARGN